MRWKFFNASGFLLQNATVITKCNNYCKFGRFCYKMLQLLQNVTFIANCDSTIAFNNSKAETVSRL